MNEINKIILIDDEDDVRLSIAQTLELEGFEVTTFESPVAALEYITPMWPGFILSDLKMPKMDGLEALARIVEIDSDLPVVIVTAHGDIPVAVQAMQDGAYDFMEKTADPEQLVGIARRALEKRRLVLENRNLRRAMDADGELENRLIGKTPVMQALRKQVLNLADTDVDVLLVGETGTGKEVVARCLHEFGARGKKPFVALNCGALTETLIESELFGHEAGAFTGASKRRIGKIEYATGGTLFLDEIESMPANLQVRLLRVLQERTLERVGGNAPVVVDIRVVAASKVDLREAATEGKFREDLLYRLQIAQIVLPSLQERLNDIPVLFRYFADVASVRYNRPMPDLLENDLQILMSRPWHGNVRELRNVVERTVLGIEDPDSPAIEPQAVCDTLAKRLAAFEKATITAALRDHKGRVGETASDLGIPRKKLYLRMQKYGLNREEFM